MSTLTEIEEAVEALPRREQETLLRNLAVKLRAPVKPATKALRKRWPVPPPKVSKAESKRIARRIEEQSGQVDWTASASVTRNRPVKTRLSADGVLQALAEVRE